MTSTSVDRPPPEEDRFQEPAWRLVFLFGIAVLWIGVRDPVGVVAGATLAALGSLLFRRLYQRSGFLAGLMILAMTGTTISARTPNPAILSTLFGFWTLYLGVAAWQEKRTFYYPAAGTALAAALLCGDLHGVILPLTGAVVALRMKARMLREGAFLRGIIWMVGTFGVLVVLSGSVTWPGRLQPYLGGFPIAGGLSPASAMRSFLDVTAPWGIVLAVGLFQILKRRESLVGAASDWLAATLLLSLLLFCAQPGTIDAALLFVPPASLLCVRTLETTPEALRRKLLIPTALLLTGITLPIAACSVYTGDCFWSAFFAMGLVVWTLFCAWTQSRRWEKTLIASVWVLCFGFGILYPSLRLESRPDFLRPDRIWQDAAERSR